MRWPFRRSPSSLQERWRWSCAARKPTRRLTLLRRTKQRTLHRSAREPSPAIGSASAHRSPRKRLNNRSAWAIASKGTPFAKRRPKSRSPKPRPSPKPRFVLRRFQPGAARPPILSVVPSRRSARCRPQPPHCRRALRCRAPPRFRPPQREPRPRPPHLRAPHATEFRRRRRPQHPRIAPRSTLATPPLRRRRPIPFLAQRLRPPLRQPHLRRALPRRRHQRRRHQRPRHQRPRHQRQRRRVQRQARPQPPQRPPLRSLQRAAPRFRCRPRPHASRPLIVNHPCIATRSRPPRRTRLQRPRLPYRRRAPRPTPA